MIHTEGEMYDRDNQEHYEQSTLFLGGNLPYQLSDSDQTENLQEELPDIWPSIPIDPCKITWLGKAPGGGHFDAEPALGYTAYGNQAETAVAYSHAVMLAVVPEFAERERGR